MTFSRFLFKLNPYLISTFIFLSFFTNAYGQITAPDTVCTNTTVTFSSQQQNTTYTWLLNSISINQTPSTLQTIVAGAPLSVTSFSTFNNDNGNYYSFVTNEGTNDITMLSYGTNPNSTPVATNLGAFGMTSSQLEGIDVVKDTAADTWYGLVVNSTQMLLLNFGYSLTNTPTGTLMNFPILQWPHQITIKKYNGQWIAFVGNRNSNVARFDFGSSLTNTPTPVLLPNAGNIVNPCNFAIHEQAGNWYMLVNSLINGTLTRLDFGADLQNNNPTGTNLGNPGNFYNIPRGISLTTNCNGDLYGYTLDENGLFIRLNFNGDITTTPVATNLGNVGGSGGMNGLTPYTYGTTLYYLFTSWASSAVYRYTILTLPSSTYTAYYNPTYTYTFNTPGIYNITLFCDQGYQSDGSAFCKQLVVIGNGSASSRDTSICQGTALTLYSGITGTQAWSTGDTTDSIIVTQQGTYWVTGSGNCGTSSDTIHLQVNPIPAVNLGNDTTLCMGSPLTLHSSGTYNSATYLWSNGNATSSIQPTQTGGYWLDVTQNGCTGKDTVNVTFNPLPTVNLGSDISSCQGDSAILISTQPTGSAYLWSTGSTQDSVHTLQSGPYWLTVTDNNGCKGRDTVNVQFNPSLVVNLGDDTTLCSGHLLTLQSSFTYTGATYLWSAGNTSPSIQVSQQGTYWLTVTKNGCSGSDTVHIAIIQSPVVQLGNDTAICQGNALTLTSTQPSGYIYTWSTGSANTSIPVTQSGAYWLSVNNNGCIANDTIHVTVNPVPDVNLGNDTSICAGKSIALASLNTFSNAAYTWSTGATNSTIQVSQAGSYWLTVNENGCKGSDTVQVAVNPVPAVALGNDTTICTGATIMLSPIVQPATNPIYTWSTGNTSPSIAVSQGGVYWVSITENGCAASDSIRISQIEKPLINLGNDTTLCPGVLFTLSAGNNNSNTVTWSNSTNNSTFSVTGTGIYYATVTNACGAATDTISVTYQYCDIWFPSAFTPNNDGKNDNIKAVGGLAEISGYKLAIYNRWGQLVFSTYDKYDGWNGNFNGVKQPIGTYNYMITYSYNGSSYKMKGDFELLR